MRETLLIGDIEDKYAFAKLGDTEGLYKASYDDILDNELPEIPHQISIFPFFPMRYWNEHIEGRYYYGVYGNYSFYTKFRSFWERINNLLSERYFWQDITYVNHPLNIPICRDKELMKSFLKRQNIRIPRSYYTRNYHQIISLLEKGRKLFVKARCGSMGKGITYLEKGMWQSNLKFHENSIISRKSDKGWEFNEVTDNMDFLKDLLRTDVVIEDAIDTYSMDGEIFDIRVIILKNEFLYMYPRINRAEKIITNISQGAKRGTMSMIPTMNESTINDIKRIAVKSVSALGLGFAGVDILLDKDFGIYVLEVNAFPGLTEEMLKIVLDKEKNKNV